MDNKREKFMDNVLQLSINSGKVNESAKYILYSENTKEDKKRKIQEINDELKKIMKNVEEIASVLETSIE